MNRFIRNTSTAAACALAFVPMLALATAVQAETIKVGDLRQPAEAARVSQAIDRAANSICREHVRAVEGLSRNAACKAAVRAEATEKLSAMQHVRMAAN